MGRHANAPKYDPELRARVIAMWNAHKTGEEMKAELGFSPWHLISVLRKDGEIGYRYGRGERRSTPTSQQPTTTTPARQMQTRAFSSKHPRYLSDEQIARLVEMWNAGEPQAVIELELGRPLRGSIQRLKKKGVIAPRPVGGRPKADDEIVALRRTGHTPGEIARMIDMPRGSVYQALDRLKAAGVELPDLKDTGLRPLSRRKAIYVYRLAGWQNREIADELDISETAVVRCVRDLREMGWPLPKRTRPGDYVPQVDNAFLRERFELWQERAERNGELLTISALTRQAGYETSTGNDAVDRVARLMGRPRTIDINDALRLGAALGFDPFEVEEHEVRIDLDSVALPLAA